VGADIEFMANLARVRWVSDDRSEVILGYAAGGVGRFNVTGPFPYAVGTVVTVGADADYAEAAPDDLWPTTSWIGIVRLPIDDETVVVEVGSSLHRVARNGVACEVGNTVQGSEPGGVEDVLSERPLRALQFPEPEEDPAGRFRRAAHGLSFADFGGLQPIVDQARELIALPLEREKELNAIGGTPIQGVLLTGPPGTGKTYLARIIASHTGAAFFQISGPEIFSKWYGESESQLRAIFDAAKKAPSSVLVIDEIDSIAGRRSDAQHEISHRVVTQLLTLMDGVTPTDNVIVVATTNFAESLDPALLRPGRFDREIEFTLPTLPDRLAILEIELSRLSTRSPLPLPDIAARTESWTPAQLSLIGREARVFAAMDGRSRIAAEDVRGAYERVAKSQARQAAREEAGRR